MSGKIVLVLLAFAFAPQLLSPSQVARRLQPVSEAEQAVLKLEREWLDAYEKFDAEAMDRIVGDDFIITFPNGEMQTKSQIMASIKAPRAATQPLMRFHTEDVQSRAYGDTVILTGRVVTEYQRDGQTVKEQSRYTDTYVKRGKRWQVVASHLSNVAEPRRKAER